MLLVFYHSLTMKRFQTSIRCIFSSKWIRRDERNQTFGECVNIILTALFAPNTHIRKHPWASWVVKFSRWESEAGSRWLLLFPDTPLRFHHSLKIQNWVTANGLTAMDERLWASPASIPLVQHVIYSPLTAAEGFLACIHKRAVDAVICP